MRRANFYRITIISMGVSLLTLFNSCARVSVTDLPVTAMKEVSLTENIDGNYKYEGTFEMGQKVRSDLDLIWVIDNSGSMAEEIAHVRTNLKKFVASIGDQTNLKMSVISKLGTDSMSFTLDTTDPLRFMQIAQEVSSTNALRLVGSGLCTDTGGACSAFSSPNVQGKLLPFLRAQSKKIFIVVSDDESEISPDTFRKVFAKAFPRQDFTLFGFVGLGTQSPCQAKTANRYIELAQSSHGSTYNICDSDWSSTFSTLAQSVLDLIVPVISLPHPTAKAEIQKVILDGQPLDHSQFKVTEAGLVINVDILQPSKKYKIEVQYRLK